MVKLLCKKKYEATLKRLLSALNTNVFSPKSEANIKIKQASFDFIRYACCWEDADILLEALSPLKGLNCLSIVSGGDNTLSLLAGNPQKVLAIDLNLTQIACLELKIACFKELKYHETLQFLGFSDALFDRLSYYKVLEKHLSEKTSNYFNNHTHLITNGIINQGKFEKYFQKFHTIALPLIHNKQKVNELLQNKSLQERINFYNQKWNNIGWQIMFKIFFSRYFMGKHGRDPAFFKHVKTNVAENILKRTEYAFTQLSTHNNPYLQYIMTGKFNNVLPHYARPENYETIRKNLHKIDIKHGKIEDLLKSTELKFDRFNLSDIFEYMDATTFKNTTDMLIQKANNKALFACWNMLVPRKLSDVNKNNLNYLAEKAERLFKIDKAFFYQAFHIEEKL
jgi:S-adenosylmethionine-diacylglycerol 3-amino-3-carboxypropyl transferase